MSNIVVEVGMANRFSSWLNARPWAQSGAIVGIDIGTTSIKFVELAATGRVPLLERYLIEPLPREAVTDAGIANPDVVVETLQRGIAAMGSKTRRAALALPAAMTITRKLFLPGHGRDEELELAVEAEASHVVPFALDEINLDFQVLGASPANPDDIEVLLAASRKDKVDERVQVARAAGLEVGVMDVESFALIAAAELAQRQLPNPGHARTCAIIDIGGPRFKMSVMRGDLPVYYREQAFGGDKLTREIQRRYGMSFDEAEHAKRQSSLPESYPFEVLQPFIDALALEIARTVQFFGTSAGVGQAGKIDYILLAGGGAALPGLDEAVSSRTGSEALLANPFLAMAPNPHLDAHRLAADASTLMVATGLALRRFDA